MESATGPWCMAMFLEIAVATGARRGEVFALGWSDIRDGYATIARWLTQTRAGLEFKCSNSRPPDLAEVTLIPLPGPGSPVEAVVFR